MDLMSPCLSKRTSLPRTKTTKPPSPPPPGVHDLSCKLWPSHRVPDSLCQMLQRRPTKHEAVSKLKVTLAMQCRQNVGADARQRCQQSAESGSLHCQAGPGRRHLSAGWAGPCITAPASIATSALLPSLLESATQGLLVQHRSALISCSSPPVSVVQIMAIANGDFRRLWCTQLLAGTGLCT